jgi:aconitate hydratase
MNFIGSPEIVLALALDGRLSFNPLDSELTADDGTKFKLDPPSVAPEIPINGFEVVTDVYLSPADDPDRIALVINNDSSRLQRLEPFAKWDGKDFENLPILAKVKGKCTTDQISPAGPWLMYRGHLDKISDNMLLGAVNAYTGGVGIGKNIHSSNIESYPHIAREYKENGVKWVIVGERNYGEGSSREHAAMTPRYLGCAAVIVKSFARIHETNLKKQGVLALTFENTDDYDKMLEGDRISILGLRDLQPGNPVRCYLHHSDGTKENINLHHSYNKSQIEWFQSGSSLNILRLKENY